MKFKLIQLGILFVFVISIVSLTPLSTVFSDGAHGDSPHDPEFHVDDCGYRKTSGTRDPRGRSYTYIVCGANGEEYVSGEGWYYRGADLSGEHDRYAIQQVYRLKISGYAHAFDNRTEGRLSPRLDFHDALPFKDDSWGGTGHIYLSIKELEYHFPRYIISGYLKCSKFTAKKHEWNPNEDAEIAINVRIEDYEATKTSTSYTEANIEGTGVFSGTFGGSYAESWKRKFKRLHGISYGIGAQVGYSWYDSLHFPHIKLQGKKANVSGYIENAEVPMCSEYGEYLTAEYLETEPTWCPGNPVVGIKKNIAHID